MKNTTPKAFTYQHQVQFVETDMVGIVHFSNFFRYMEVAEDALLRHLAIPLVAEPPDPLVSYPRLSASCSFRSPIRYPDIVTVHVQVIELGEKKIRYRFQFSVDDRACAEGEILTICCRMAPTLESIPIPATVRKKLLPYCIVAPTS